MKPTVLRRSALFLLLAPLAALQAGDEGPIVGAIRWDGWYGDGTVTKAVEASLGQPKYHFRLPWFAQLQSDGAVRINGDSQANMEQEIAYAAAARLNYWAFVDYWDEAPGLSVALNHYLVTKDKRGIRYCLVEEGHRLDKSAARAGSDWSNTFSSPITRPCSTGVRCCLCMCNPRNSAGPSGMTCGVRLSLLA